MDIASTFRKGISIILKALGGFLIFFAATGFVIVFTGEKATDMSSQIIMILMSIGFIIGGISCIRKGITMNKGTKYNRAYTELIMNSQLRSIEDIALAVNKEVIDAEKDIQLMINRGQLKNAYIDFTNHEIIFRSAEEIQQAQQAPGSIQTEVVRCPGCGAKNTIQSHKKAVCEYCGMGLKKED